MALEEPTWRTALEFHLYRGSNSFLGARVVRELLGVLHSRFHIAWALKMASRHGVGNDPTYNAHSVFATYPFPPGLTPDVPVASMPKASGVEVGRNPFFSKNGKLLLHERFRAT